jgi:hypothetical protein
MTRLSTRCGGRRPKSAKARNRGTDPARSPASDSASCACSNIRASLSIPVLSLSFSSRPAAANLFRCSLIAGSAASASSMRPISAASAVIARRDRSSSSFNRFFAPDASAVGSVNRRSSRASLSGNRVSNADNPERASWGTATASDHAQERILTYRQHQPFCESCRRSTAKRQTEVMDDRVQPRRASRRRSQYPFGEALSEDLAPAQDGVTAEAAGDHQELHNPPRERQIGYASSIPAMDTSGNRSARWTQKRFRTPGPQ